MRGRRTAGPGAVGDCRTKEVTDTMSDRPVATESAKATKLCWPRAHTRALRVFFVGLTKDANWADIEERSGSVRSHPVAWLDHSNGAR